ncbi:rhodanese-like domain-containing protein [Rhodopirellula sp. P2]|uniref:rhodanese-like domain-containing protein n=1 Tax=Rhodopirellula sp. P2 TaxID=2127060 RepID=UPI0023678F6A|nr:rhodanese-like domain-containing protein [Rhodopirellula sp. P2]WDQ17143.1 rhodanese-like domain-containing protein [Rhodopirellula sp. P2]
MMIASIRPLFGFMAVLVLMSIHCQTVSAQFGGLFGGPKVETIDTQTVRQLLANQKKQEDQAKQNGSEVSDPGFVVVDVRSDKETRVSVIPGAITKEMYEKDAAKYRGRLVIAYCTVGGRSGAYAKQLLGKGVKVKNYKGSILKWVDAGLPLVTLKGEPTNRVHTYSDRYKIPSKYEQVTE